MWGMNQQPVASEVNVLTRSRAPLLIFGQTESWTDLSVVQTCQLFFCQFYEPAWLNVCAD
ncbi:hypothetical protein AG1IA_02166 [Rhizoctonia solani AG-1 IA]|uniref:Uncharacterized protein n=1 Tax=Thanatephorus cucumeris (strain AG1-IA) TaxID=983506 RepID=L8X0I3_THACA|nr:hypothetical protein AG1IA_02166 [Rhizoctonia solani AG-1 IA]